jgi:hypothetical protein
MTLNYIGGSSGQRQTRLQEKRNQLIRQHLGRHNTWNAQEIARNESKTLCAMGFYSFTASIDMKPGPGARYIHSASEPYNEEQEISQERINAWMDHVL